MRRLKRIIAFVLAFSLIIGIIPISHVSHAAEAGYHYDETLLLSDDFETENWNTAKYNWRLNSENYAGIRNGTAPLGYTTGGRNLYRGNGDADNSLTDVHIKADVYVDTSYGGTTSQPQLHFLTVRCDKEAKGGIVFGFSTQKNNNGKSSLIVGTYAGGDTITPFESGQTEVIYDIDKTYTLELYVVGNYVVAKCGTETSGIETIFEDFVSDIPTNGYCGVTDRRATSNSKASNGSYGVDGGYTKGGYFDNFELYEVNRAATNETYTDGTVEATVSISECSWNKMQDGTQYPISLFAKKNGEAGMYTRLAVTKAGDTVSAELQTEIQLSEDTEAYQTVAIPLTDFAWDTEYVIRLRCIGNYIELQVNDEVKLQRTLDVQEHGDFIAQDGEFGYEKVIGANTAITVFSGVSDFETEEYAAYSVTKDETILLEDEQYEDFLDDSAKNERTAFLKGETLILTVSPGENQQLAAVEGLTYYIGNDTSVKYSITDRLGDAGADRDICKQFVIEMPADAINIADNYYTKGNSDGNIGIIGVSIREKNGTKKYGTRFSSRAYKEYTDENGISYRLTEVGTLLFKERDELTDEMLEACYESESKVLLDEYGNTMGKRVPATRAQDICNEYLDWGLILTYEDDTILFDVEYTALPYAVYEAEDGTPVVKYGTNQKTYNYNQVANKIGYDEQKAPYLFYDVFSSEAREEWSFTKDSASTYGIENGKLSIGYDASQDKASAVTGKVAGGDEWTDYAVSADVTFDSEIESVTERGRCAGLVARRTGNYHYEFRLTYTQKTSTTQAMLYRTSTDKSSNALVSLTHAQLKELLGGNKVIALGEQYNMRLEVHGKYIRCYVDDVQVIEYEDTSEYALLQGTAGLKSTNNIGTYEDFIVEEIGAGLYLSGTNANGVLELYEGFDIDLPSHTLLVVNQDGSHEEVSLRQEMISEYDNTKVGEQEITLTYGDIQYCAKVLISARPNELTAFATAVADAKEAVDDSSITEKKETIQTLKEQYDSFSPYELSKVDDTILETYEGLMEALERAYDANLTNYSKLLADSLNNVTEDTWNESIMGNSAKWIALNGTLYEAQNPYNLAVTGWHSPDVYGEIYSISADMTMLSKDMYMGIAMNMSETGHYHARVKNTTDTSGVVSYTIELLKYTSSGYDYLKRVEASELGLDIQVSEKFNLRMTLLNGVLNVYVDDVLALTYDDSTNNYQHTSGECGLRVLNGDGIFDNIRVYGTALEREDSGETPITATTYADNFEDEPVGESPSHWLENYQATTVVDNWKVYEENGSNVYGTEGISGLTETWLHVFEKNPEFEAKFMVESADENSEVGFITRRSPDTAFVNIGYDFNESKWYISSQESEAGGCEFFWAENTSELAVGEWYTARIEASGECVTLYINGDEAVTSDSVKHTGFGRVGFFTNNASMYVDDVDCTFKHGDIPQDGLISYVIEPDTYSNYMEIESTDDGQTLIGVGTTKKLSTDAGITWTDVTSDATWSGLKTGNYPTLLELHDGTYIQILQNENFAVQASKDMKSWEAVGQIVSDEEISDSEGRKVAILHVNSATEIELEDGSYRIFCPVAFRKYNTSGSIAGHYTKIYYSDDAGATWSCSNTTTKDLLPGYTDSDSTTWSESKIIKCSDGTLRMYYSRNYLGCMQYTVSEDNGVTWEGMYQIPELQCAMTSFAIIEDPTVRGTYYMLWINGAADYLGSMLPRVRPCLLRSTDGMNWEFLMNCEYMPEIRSTTNGEALYQILDPSLYVTEDYVYVTFGRSEREYAENNANSHQAQRCYYLRVEKEKLTSRAWDASTIANMKYPKAIEISTMPQTEFKYNATFSFSDGVIKFTALDGTVRYENMTKNCAVYNKPDMTASDWLTDATETVEIYYVNGYKLSYDITIKKRLSW